MTDIVYVDMDGVLVEFPESLETVHPSINHVCRSWCEETGNHHSDFEGIFSTLLPKDGAEEAISRLMNRYEVYLLSTAPWDNRSSFTEKRNWIEHHLPMLPRKRLLLTYRKDLQRGRYLIDDRPKHGAEAFGDYPGQEWIHFGSEAYPSWREILRHLDC
jgi:5'-nucleotidase